MPQLRRLLTEHMDVAFRHDVQTETLRRVSDILKAEAELTDRHSERSSTLCAKGVDACTYC